MLYFLHHSYEKCVADTWYVRHSIYGVNESIMKFCIKQNCISKIYIWIRTWILRIFDFDLILLIYLEIVLPAVTVHVHTVTLIMHTFRTLLCFAVVRRGRFTEILRSYSIEIGSGVKESRWGKPAEYLQISHVNSLKIDNWIPTKNVTNDGYIV